MERITKKIGIRRTVQLGLVGLLLASSCVNFSDIKSPLDGIKLMINYNIFNTFLSFTFIDAASGAPIGATDNQAVEVQISGDAGTAVVDQLGNHKTSYSSVFGLLSLALNPKDPWKPTTENKLGIQIDATCPGYKPASLSLQIDSTGKYQYKVMMEKTSVDAVGIKKYVYQLNLNSTGALENDITISSTGHEAILKLKKGTQFMGSTRAVDLSTYVNLSLTVYTKLSSAPVPGELVENVQLKSNTVQPEALDLYRVVDVQISNGSLQSLTSLGINQAILRYKIDSLAYHPITKTSVLPGNDAKTYAWQPGNSQWQVEDSLKIQSDSLGYYVESVITNTGIHAAGMHTGLCGINGQVAYSLQGSFPTYPVSTLVYVYRKIDTRYVGNLRLDAPQNGSAVTMNLNVPANTPVRSYIYSYSGSNAFSAKPEYFDFEAGCGTFGPVWSTLTYTPPVVIPTVPVSGTVTVNVGDGFSSDPFRVTANLYQASNNQLLYSNQYNIGKSSNQFNISANLPPNTNVILQIVAADNQNSFTCSPANYSFNTGSATGLTRQFAVTPIYSTVNLNFNFARSSDLPNSTFTVKAELINMADQSDVQDIIFLVLPGQTAYTTRLFLSKLIQYQVNLKRVDGAPVFMAYPYQFVLGNITQTDYSYSSTLSPVVLKPVSIKITVVCKQTEIIPTLHGYYKTVWDDQWQQTDIVNGILNLTSEINATYVLGLIVNGQMQTDNYLFDDSTLNFNFNLDDADCSKMGW